MTQVLLHPTYFPSIAHASAFLNCQVTFEVWDNYQKQTYRNRMYIYGSNGRQLLVVPISHKSRQSRLYRDIRIDHSSKWQQNHWKTLETAYRSSPYFEFYEHLLRTFFETSYTFLIEQNMASIDLISQFMDVEIPYKKTTIYEACPQHKKDLRGLSCSKNIISFGFESYFQLFCEKHGFLENLSVLDLIFNQGPEGVDYLKRNDILRVYAI